VLSKSNGTIGGCPGQTEMPKIWLTCRAILACAELLVFIIG